MDVLSQSKVSPKLYPSNQRRESCKYRLNTFGAHYCMYLIDFWPSKGRDVQYPILSSAKLKDHPFTHQIYLLSPPRTVLYCGIPRGLYCQIHYPESSEKPNSEVVLAQSVSDHDLECCCAFYFTVCHFCSWLISGYNDHTELALIKVRFKAVKCATNCNIVVM